MTDGRDLIDKLIDWLNDGVDQITFDRDVLEVNRPEDWGAVELVGQEDGEWADGRMIDQTLTAEIWVCLSDRGSQIREDVQQVLRSFGDLYDISWKLVRRNYLYDLDKVIWQWTVVIEEPLDEWPEDEDEDEEDEGEDDGEGEPEGNDPEGDETEPEEEPEEEPENEWTEPEGVGS